ncbi:TIGR02569 family protein [Georgenia sp. EYE_87]|uniref:phosphotransferase n=1 Tax=Georgenia sp. EYE_87 TaxID=2853448 RepID=UPI0020030DA1|nr:phosphotransferase [Georgenia sp. EYE_87]MCK6209594.1 TIGR02569 family protein [Georgenia sp. EYE_87]
MTGPPPRSALDAFGGSGKLEPLDGGQGTAWRAGALVLKPLDMSEAELEWQADVLAAVDGAPDVRVAPPVRSAGGLLVVEGWTAWRFEVGSPPTTEQYREVMAAGRAFHRHLDGWPRPAFLDRRDHPWARADRVAWSEEPPPDRARQPHVKALLDARRPVRGPAQLVHGDLTDNVHLHPHLPPLVLDLSPYWRPPSYATAIVAADAVVFRGAGLGLIESVCAEEAADFPQLLVRALLFRAVADHLLAPEKDEDWVRWFAPAVRAVVALAERR